MISVEECRNKLGEVAEKMSDQRVVEIRDYIAALCSNVIRDELQKYKDSKLDT